MTASLITPDGATGRPAHSPAARPENSPAGPAMRAARPQTGAGRIGVAGPLLALVLVAVGVVLVQDMLAGTGAVPGRSWLAAATGGLDGMTAAWWMIPVGVAVALAGVWLVVTALRPRSRKTLPVTSATGVFLRTRDIARLAAAAAEDVDGVLHAGSVASRRKVTVTVESDRDGVADDVRETVSRRLSALVTPVAVKVRVRAATPPRKDS